MHDAQHDIVWILSIFVEIHISGIFPEIERTMNCRQATHVISACFWANPLNPPIRGGLSRITKFLAHHKVNQVGLRYFQPGSWWANPCESSWLTLTCLHVKGWKPKWNTKFEGDVIKEEQLNTWRKKRRRVVKHFRERSFCFLKFFIFSICCIRPN